MRLEYILLFSLFLLLMGVGFTALVGADGIPEFDGVAVASDSLYEDDHEVPFKHYPSIDHEIDNRIHEARASNDNDRVPCIDENNEYTGEDCELDSGTYYLTGDVELDGGMDAVTGTGTVDIVIDGGLDILGDASIGSISRDNATNVFVDGGVSIAGCSVVNGEGDYTGNRTDFIFWKSSNGVFTLEIGSHHNYTMIAPDAIGEIKEGEYSSFFDASIDEDRTRDQAVIGRDLGIYVDLVNQGECGDTQAIKLDLRHKESNTSYLSLESTVDLDGDEERVLEFIHSETGDMAEGKYILNASSNDDFDTHEIELHRPTPTRVTEPPIFEVTDVSEFPGSLTVGETAEFSTLVENTGGSGTRNLVLGIEDKEEKRHLLGLSQGEEEWINWNAEFEEPGSYPVSIGDQELGVIEVEPQTQEEESEGTNKNRDGVVDTETEVEETEPTDLVNDQEDEGDETSLLDWISNLLF